MSEREKEDDTAHTRIKTPLGRIFYLLGLSLMLRGRQMGFTKIFEDKFEQVAVLLVIINTTYIYRRPFSKTNFEKTSVGVVGEIFKALGVSVEDRP
jgi:hypothetical protein